MTFPKKDNGRIACRALFDQCCMSEGLIRYNLANSLGLSRVVSQSKSFSTAAGTFTTNHIIQINDVMPPCLSQNFPFTIALMVIQQNCSCEMTYRVIMGEESMQKLDVDTSILEGTISLGERQIFMVSRDYLMEERVHSKRNRMMKQSLGLLPFKDQWNQWRILEKPASLKHSNQQFT